MPSNVWFKGVCLNAGDNPLGKCEVSFCHNKPTKFVTFEPLWEPTPYYNVITEEAIIIPAGVYGFMTRCDIHIKDLCGNNFIINDIKDLKFLKENIN